MLRSLLSIIVAVIIGLTTAKFVEGAGAALLSDGVVIVGDGETASLSYTVLLSLGWLAGAFAAAMVALVIGKRWAPLGFLAGASMLFSAIMTLMSFSLSWFLWPVSALATGAGSLAAVKLLKAQMTYPAATEQKDIFSD